MEKDDSDSSDSLMEELSNQKIRDYMDLNDDNYLYNKNLEEYQSREALRAKVSLIVNFFFFAMNKFINFF
jgi:hypothetical protein